MLDIKLLRENKQTVIDNLNKRPNFDTTIVDTVLNFDEKWREANKELEELKSQKNTKSKEIANKKKQGEDISTILDKVQELTKTIENKEENVKTLLEQRNSSLEEIPNLLENEVPEGEDDEENVAIKHVGEQPKFKFEPKNHMQLCEQRDWYDLETAAKHSGARFYYLKNELVMLQLALFQFALDHLLKQGYTPFEVPPMLKKQSAKRAIPHGDFEDLIYSLKDDNQELYLIGTSEHALAVYHADQTLNHKDLPKRYVGISPCFRREAGVTKDSKGIFRVHNFNKIEQFIYSTPEQSEEFLNEILGNAEYLFQQLEIPYRIVDICTGDIGSFASRKYDVEAWIPSQNQYKEMVSASNYKDFGARRLNVRYQRKDNEIEHVHTLNSTAIALTRTIIALIENHQQEDGSVKIPKALQPYIGGRTTL